MSSTLWMCEPAATDSPNAEVFHRKPLLRRLASPSRSGEDDRARVRRDLRVLVVDDDHDQADSLVKLVRRSGHAALKAHDGLAALRVAAVQHPDVVLLDMEMPFMDGRHVARHLRLDFPRRECFIIAVSTPTAEEHRQQRIESDIDLHLNKPLDPSVVETLLLLECALMNRRQTR